MKCIEPTMFFTVLGTGNIKVGHFALRTTGAKDLINEAIYMLVNIRQSNMDLAVP